MATESQPLSQKFEIFDLEIISVTVYNDRAEIHRKVTAKLEPGLNEVVFAKLPETAKEDSVTVNGHGDAVIQGVKIDTVPAVADEQEMPRLQDLKKQLTSYKYERETVDNEQKVFQKRQELLSSIIKECGGKLVERNMKENGPFHVISDNVNELLEFHQIQHSRILKEMQRIQESLREFDERIKNIKDQIAQVKQSRNYIRNVCVTLESQENCEVDLSITYQVSNASWHPSYEIRVESDANTLKLLCFGNINQNTGEDWINASINLSTSKPIIGGVLPKLGTLVAEFFKPEPVPQFAAFAQPCAARTKPRALLSADMVDAESYSFGAVAYSSEMAHSAVTYAESSMSTTFTIPNRKSIMSNTTDHKLLMTSVILDTTMCYECIPSKSTNVYLTAYVINDSSVPFLAGQAAIYVDNCFVGKHTFNAVSPGERFKCLLTIDPAIKVEYKPVNKYTEQVGLITKSVTTMHERTVVIKNTKSSSVLVIIRENIPKSTDEKIKIKLYSPELDSKDEREFLVPTIGARLDVDHNLECVQKIESNDKKELLIKWSTEHPKEETVNFREVFSHGNS